MIVTATAASVSSLNKEGEGMDIITIAVFLGGIVVGGALGIAFICIFMGATKYRRRRTIDGKIKNVRRAGS